MINKQPMFGFFSTTFSFQSFFLAKKDTISLYLFSIDCLSTHKYLKLFACFFCYVLAMDNLAFLHKWLIKFPQYRNRSLFIAGESYAGHYIPQLAELMLRFNKKEMLFNLKGIAVSLKLQFKKISKFDILKFLIFNILVIYSLVIQFWNLQLISIQGQNSSGLTG